MATISRTRALPHALRTTGWPQSQHATRSIATAAAVEHTQPQPFVPQHAPKSSTKRDRKGDVRNAKPFSDFLTDTFNRQHDYLRISLTERCNLRCLYCMPEEGVQLSPNKDILTTAEVHYLSALFVNQGVTKIRLTGGEPTVRKDIIPLMQQLGSLRQNGLKEIALTTNAISLHRKLDQMVEAGLTGVNISLDTLDPHQFVLLTRRQGFDAVMKSINRVQEMNKLGAGIKLKINCVAMRGLNDHQILPFVEMTREQDIEIRFIEYMPFGGNKWSERKMLPYTEMLDIIRSKYSAIFRLKGAKNDTSKTWQVPGFQGRVGFITSMTHNFCGTCNRLRITSDGNLKVCLHGNAEVSLRDLLRKDQGGEPMDEAAFDAIRQIELDRRNALHSDLRMDGDEGWISKERELLDVIGAAVKRKKAAHAGMGELENMQNRPMILIGERKSSFDTQPQRKLRQQGTFSHWSDVPLHLLSAPTGTTGLRQFSSDSRQPDDEADREGEPQPSDQPQSPSPPSLSGFQSLHDLFQGRPQGRYSAPRAPQATEVSKPRLATSHSEDQDRDVGPTFFESSNTFVRPQSQEKFVAPPKLTDPVAGAEGRSANEVDPTAQLQEGKAPVEEIHRQDASSDRGSYMPHGPELEPRPDTPRIRKHESDQALVRRLTDNTEQSAQPPRRLRRNLSPQSKIGPRRHDSGSHLRRRDTDAGSTGFRRPKSRVPNPFEESIPQGRSRQSYTPPQEASAGAAGAWGLSANNEKLVSATPDTGPQKADRHRDAGYDPSHLHSAAKPPSNDRLTHVKTSGEAHMVDIGAKQGTKRVAIAVAKVTFSNSKPLQLIEENSNIKGDVLGVARVAGIMAAKRTSDLIPLCHPLSLSKVEIDFRRVKKDASGKRAVQIIAHVECVGPTGVEMEAMTAAITSALTVFDMCKAVDKKMIIASSRVLYKSGGKSGLQYVDGWGSFFGPEYFTERGLEVPPTGARRQRSDTIAEGLESTEGIESKEK